MWPGRACSRQPGPRVTTRRGSPALQGLTRSLGGVGCRARPSHGARATDSDTLPLPPCLPPSPPLLRRRLGRGPGPGARGRGPRAGGHAGGGHGMARRRLLRLPHRRPHPHTTFGPASQLPLRSQPSARPEQTSAVIAYWCLSNSGLRWFRRASALPPPATGP